MNINRDLKKKVSKSNCSGLSLIETLVVVLVFSIIGVLTTNSIFMTLRGTQKAQSTLKVREKVNYAISSIQRHLRSAQKITECPNSDSYLLEYFDENGNPSTFSCVDMNDIGYIASGSARIISNDVDITFCNISCEISTVSGQISVDLEIIAEDVLVTGITKGKASFSTQVDLRNY